MMTRAEQSGLYEKYAPMIFGRCRRFLRCMDEAQEATGEVFNQLVDHWDGLSREGTVHLWIHRTTVRMCLAELRKEKTWLHKGEARWHEDERFAGLSREAIKAIDMLIGRTFLPWETLTREIAMFAYWDGLSQEEISSLVGIPAETVQGHLDRAREWTASSPIRNITAAFPFSGLSGAFA